MTALHGGLGRRDERESGSDGRGHVIPVVGFEIGAAERAPFVLEDRDQSVGLVVGPAGRWDPPMRGGLGC